MHIGALARADTDRNPEQPHQAHDVVDAQDLGMAHVGAQRGNERGVGCLAKAIRVWRRQAPILAAQVKVVWRRTDVRAGRVKVLIRPGFRSLAVDRHRETPVEADTEPSLARSAYDGAEL